MGSCKFKVKLSPRGAFNRIKDLVNVDLVYSEFNNLDHEKSTGSSEGLFLKFDWGASKDFAYSVKDIMEEYII